MNNKKATKPALLAIAVLLGVLLLSGCTRNVSAIPTGWSGSIESDGTLYTGSMSGNIVAVSVEDNTFVFEPVPLEEQQTGGGLLGCSQASTAIAMYGTPALYKDLVYVAGYTGRIYAFNNENGASRWIFPRDGYVNKIIGGITADSGNLYFADSDGKVYALDAETGDDRVWNEPFQTGDKIWSTPAVEGDSLYIGSFDKKLYAIDTATGRAKWDEPFETEGAIVSAPVVDNGAVIIGSFDRHIYSIDAATGKELWRYPENDGDENKPGNWFWSTPVIHDGAIYAGCLDGNVYILNAASGKLIDRIDLGAPISSSPAIVDDLLVIAATQERPAKTMVYTIDLDNNKEMLILGIEEEVYASLAPGDGVFYMHTARDILYEVDAKTGTKRTLTIKIAEESDE